MWAAELAALNESAQALSRSGVQRGIGCSLLCLPLSTSPGFALLLLVVIITRSHFRLVLPQPLSCLRRRLSCRRTFVLGPNRTQPLLAGAGQGGAGGVQGGGGGAQDMKYMTEARTTLVYDMPLAEVVTDFFDQLKSLSAGYASMDYSITGPPPPPSPCLAYHEGRACMCVWWGGGGGAQRPFLAPATPAAAAAAVADVHPARPATPARAAHRGAARSSLLVRGVRRRPFSPTDTRGGGCGCPAGYRRNNLARLDILVRPPPPPGRPPSRPACSRPPAMLLLSRDVAACSPGVTVPAKGCGQERPLPGTQLNGEKVDPLSLIVHKDDAYRTGRSLVKRLHELIPRQQFKVPNPRAPLLFSRQAA